MLTLATDATPSAAPDLKSLPYNAIVRITETIDGNGWQGSGVLISPDEVLTAGHISYKSGNGGHVAENIEVVPNYQQGSEPFGAYVGTVAHYIPVINEPYITYDGMSQDYSIIHLSKPVIGGSVMTLSPDFAGGQVHVSGYPLSANGALIDTVQTIASDPNYTIYESTPLGEGSSGGPLWNYGADGTAQLYGVVSAVSGDTAYDVKLTAAKVAQIQTWVAADDASLVATGPVAPPVVVQQPPTPPANPDPVPVVSTEPVVVPPPVSPPLPPPAPVTPDPVPVVTLPATVDPALVTPVVLTPVDHPPAPTTPPVSICDATGKEIADILSKAYSGPVQGLLKQYVDTAAHGLNIAANVAGWFIHTGQGDDAVALHSGANVVDGGAGSNFMSAGTGLDTFFVDARNLAADTWATVSKFHSGDAATVWGVSAGSSIDWTDGAGASGYKGLTMHSHDASGKNASFTLAGFTKADMAAGKLQASFGHDVASNSDYLYVKAV